MLHDVYLGAEANSKLSGQDFKHQPEPWNWKPPKRLCTQCPAKKHPWSIFLWQEDEDARNRTKRGNKQILHFPKSQCPQPLVVIETLSNHKDCIFYLLVDDVRSTSHRIFSVDCDVTITFDFCNGKICNFSHFHLVVKTLNLVTKCFRFLSLKLKIRLHSTLLRN